MVFTIHSHGRRLGYITWTIYVSIHSPFLTMLHIIFGFDWPCREIGQGHPSVTIYTNFVDLRSLMLHAKFQNHRPSGSEEENFKKFLLFIAMVAILVMWP